MRTIGVRELRQRASEYLKAVEAGGSFEITAHGRPVALLVQARSASRRDLLTVGGTRRPRSRRSSGARCAGQTPSGDADTDGGSCGGARRRAVRGRD